MLILVGNEMVSAQTYQFSGSTSIKCGAENCMITIPYTIYATDDNQTECGQWNFSVSFGTITDPCSKITGIDNFQWKNISFPQGSVYDTYGETAHGQNVNFHLPDDEDYDIELKFTVHTLCGDYHPTRNFDVTQEDSCTGCTASFCYEEAFDCEYEEEPFAVRIDSITFYDSQGFYSFSDGNQYFNGPYYLYGGGICQLVPNMYDMIDDLNAFLDYQHFGHAVIKFYDINDPGYSGCKIRFRVRESDLMMENIFSSIYDLAQCQIGDVYCDEILIEAEVESDQCIESQMLDPNKYYDKTVEQIFILKQEKFEHGSIDNNNAFKILAKSNYSMSLLQVISFTPELSKVEIQIFNIAGQKVLPSKIIDSNQKSFIDISSICSGIYYIVGTNIGTGLISVDKFIK